MSQMADPLLQKPGRCAEIVPKNGSYCIVVDGIEWSRHDDLNRAEAVCNSIVANWARYYEPRAARLEQAAGAPAI